MDDEQPKRRKLKPGALLTLVSNVVLIYSALSLLAQLDSWDAVRDFLARLGEDLQAIAELIARVVHTVLIPWVALRDFIFGLVPLSIPPEWRDPVLLGLFIIGLFLGAGIFNWVARSRRWVLQGAEILEQTIIASALEPEREKHADRIEFLVKKLEAELIAMGAISDLVRALRREAFPEDLLLERANRAVADVVTLRRKLEENWREMVEQWKIERRALRRRALLATILLLALSVDQLFAGAGFVALSILWRSIVVFLIFAVVAVILGSLAFPLMVLVLNPLTKLLGKIPWVEEQMESRFAPWFFGHMRSAFLGDEDPPASADTPSNGNQEPAPLLASDEWSLQRVTNKPIAVLVYRQDVISLALVHHIEHEIDKGHFYAVSHDNRRQLLAKTQINPKARTAFHSMKEIILQLARDERVLDSMRVPLRHLWEG